MELEAKKWITENWVGIDDAIQDGLFAGHVFDTKEDALNFIDKLYNLGAEKILIGEVKPYSEMEPNRPYADELIVELPEGSTKRQEIFSFLNASEPSEDYEEQGQKTISVFWDY
ncbi:hypothetical protein A3A70_01315 [candidate division WWE3 bacterium RIFCSPLOWO2_01_FULL_42_11]|uniref:Uncharacterized protein n=1 Tax=candidate division WWE3 bacterium RIFCSPLOWO2_01_FULL_42_11 TaxID=1802627 RepID=A0A1F4VQN2_UNCKA|nr:MAG: hypothetical protein A3A70_01315 [candidate division WWE3 bacterium RIFCSPLOWO2_01_FULL_42_11]